MESKFVSIPSAIYLRPVVLYHVAVFIQNLQFGYWWSLHGVPCSRSSGDIFAICSHSLCVSRRSEDPVGQVEWIVDCDDLQASTSDAKVVVKTVRQK
jgi:hypothetical protein